MPFELKTREDWAIWIAMKKELQQLNSYPVKNQYHVANNMEGWEAEKRRVEKDARDKILKKQKKEKEEEKKKRKEEREATELKNVLEAAEGLLSLKTYRPYTRREERKNKKPLEPTRRSSRIEDKNKSKCPGCEPYFQPNQMAHVGPNGCLGDDIYQ